MEVPNHKLYTQIINVNKENFKHYITKLIVMNKEKKLKNNILKLYFTTLVKQKDILISKSKFEYMLFSNCSNKDVLEQIINIINLETKIVYNIKKELFKAYKLKQYIAILNQVDLLFELDELQIQKEYLLKSFSYNESKILVNKYIKLNKTTKNDN